MTDQLWQDFHDVVNMTSRELSEWLRTRAAGEETEAEPDHAGPERGRQVLAILGKRRVDLTDRDQALMRSVVDQITALREEEPTAGDRRWRHRLMAVGHDPLKPS